MSEKIRVAVAGQGRSGYGIHVKYYKIDDRFQVVAVADELPERREQAEKELGCKSYSSALEMLEKAPDFDLFVNATPSRFHVETSMAVLQKKRCKALLTEKPSATTVADFDKLTALANEANILLYPFQNSRFYPFFIKMQEIIKSGVLGEIVYIRSNWSNFSRRWDWQTRQDQLGGNLFNTGPHPVDQAVVLFGEAYPTVTAKFYAHHWDFPGDAENFALVNLKGEGHPTIDIKISSFQAYPEDMYRIDGTLGSLRATPQEIEWKYFDPAKAPKHDFWKPWSDNRQYCSEQLDWITEKWEHDVVNSNSLGYNEIVHGVYDNLYHVLNDGAAQEIRLEQVRRQIYIMEEAHKQNPLPIKPLC